jgi:hypothetical protein
MIERQSRSRAIFEESERKLSNLLLQKKRSRNTTKLPSISTSDHNESELILI